MDIVVLTELSDQEPNDYLILFWILVVIAGFVICSKPAPAKPAMTTRIKNSLAHFRVVEVYVKLWMVEDSRNVLTPFTLYGL